MGGTLTWTPGEPYDPPVPYEVKDVLLEEWHFCHFCNNGDCEMCERMILSHCPCWLAGHEPKPWLTVTRKAPPLVHKIEEEWEEL